ncbi:ParA family protein [Mycoplasma putrefaciens]|uniref:Soj/ParA family protein n=1 Tax=Mycoplasma putrefaciens (strain ATCC 15718 / NCTC 10155 / C30 KS-1 / KS-1) TaxID=743965 RepID=A0A7U3ZSW6_MYCPK|nr:ParA family protein [Mycoplasma putrefaciens]AEM68873.1 Soj/ParA family protein [Mycoplasma putrefaciens KS1]
MNNKVVNIISFGRLKGGVGKTTLNLNIAGALANQGKKILVIDFNPQASITQTLRQSVEQVQSVKGSEQWLSNEVSYDELRETIFPSFIENIDFVASTSVLEKQNRELVSKPSREKRLISNIIKIGEEQNLLTNYDHIIIDTNPAFDPITENVYIACAFRDGVIQVVNDDPFSLTGAIKNLKIWEKKYMNDRFSKVPNALKGILVNKVKSNNLLKNIIKTLNSDDFVFKDLVLRTIIIENAAIKKSIFQQNTKQDKIKLDFAINNKKLNNWQKPKWIKENENLNKLINNGNPIANLVLELKDKQIIK